jgi:hypothetical protein
VGGGDGVHVQHHVRTFGRCPHCALPILVWPGPLLSTPSGNIQ